MKSAMTSSPLRVAIIGAGQVADKVHASYYCTRNDLELVAVCDSRLSQAQALAEKYGNASVWDDPQAMLLAVKPDVVSVCSPNRFHYEHTLMALEAGCHVMCEKPPAMTPEQAREMCDTARKLGKVLAYDFHHRFALNTQQLREQVTNGVLPQDDSFMAKPAINLAKYKAAAGKQTILLDYSRAEVNEMQILKQADVVMLNYMLPEQFSAASCLANLQFYEPRTIHDSSLSKAIHGIVAARCGLLTQSYQFWREGTEIDLGADPHSCDDGIHAAATGAIWLGAIQGFAGVSVRDGELHLNPALPEQWQQLSFPLFWQGCELQVTLDAQRIAIRTSAPVSLRLNGQLITVAEESVFCLGDFILPFNGTATKHQEDE
ncbi:Gfo/Idh/MocA family oxidoreductase [Escherichia coli]|nr:Gfo/Idh/MocA family oxidoreductase [Escherichia coli]